MGGGEGDTNLNDCLLEVDVKYTYPPNVYMLERFSIH